MSKPEDKTTLAESRASSVGTDSGEPRASLLLYHRDGAKVVPLVKGAAVVVGREHPADAVVADRTISRQHARFTWDGVGFAVEDMGSTNGTKVAGERVTRASVKPGEEVVLGGVTASFHLVAPREAPIAGMDGYERFVEALEDDVLRARSFGRAHALLMVRAAARGAGQASRWYPRVRQLLRAVDRVAPFGPSALLVSLPETGVARATEIAGAIVRGRVEGEPALLAGVAAFPDNAASSDELLDAVRSATQRASEAEPVTAAPAVIAAAPAQSRGGVIVASARMREVHETVQRVARSAIPILIYGETGTGKELVARAIHESSPRRDKPLRCVNCAAIPATLLESLLFGHEKDAFTGAEKQQKGIFEQAHGGTVFLDEVGELSPAAQAALLRVLETKRVSRIGSSQETEVDVRVVAATHRDLEAMAQAGTFRLDLVYRLNTMVVDLPPLRDRAEEIAPLADALLGAANEANGASVRGVSPDAMDLLRAHSWPGNVRELRNAIERAVVIAQGELITPEDLPERVRRSAGATMLPAMGPASAPPGASLPAAASSTVAPPDGASADFKDRVRRYEVELLLDALRGADWNQTEAARRLGMPLRTLVHKMKQYGIRKTYEGR